MNLTVEWVPNMHMTEKKVEGWDALQIPVIRVATLRRVLEHINTEVHREQVARLREAVIRAKEFIGCGVDTEDKVLVQLLEQALRETGA